MDKVRRRSFLEKAGVTLAAGSATVNAHEAEAALSGGAADPAREWEDPARYGTARRVVEWSYRPEKAYADPFNDVELDVVFTDPDGRQPHRTFERRMIGEWRTRRA